MKFFLLSGKWCLMLSLMITFRVKIWPTHEMQLVLLLYLGSKKEKKKKEVLKITFLMSIVLLLSITLTLSHSCNTLFSVSQF